MDGWMAGLQDGQMFLVVYIAWLIAKNAMPATNKQVTEPINKTKFQCRQRSDMELEDVGDWLVPVPATVIGGKYAPNNVVKIR